MPQATLPLFPKIWFLLSAPVVVVDAIFVLMRANSVDVPHPLADTPPFKYWLIYAEHDHRYAPNDDAFVVLQSWLNLVEVALGLLVALLALGRAQNAAIKLAIVVSLMTLYKTVIYLGIDVVEGSKYTKHNTLQDQVLMFVIPSSVWLVASSVILRQCFSALVVANVPGPVRTKSAASQQPKQQQQQQQQQQHSPNENKNKKKH
ncbi:Emopamil binding protein [Novymonas esmeraldas]|uniref:Emopamil binding protein n=1 Tax=Novymonas esmeraldas TaxID=1808958 RepID=A0AAW0EVE4_9TRYP